MASSEVQTEVRSVREQLGSRFKLAAKQQYIVRCAMVCPVAGVLFNAAAKLAESHYQGVVQFAGLFKVFYKGRHGVGINF